MSLVIEIRNDKGMTKHVVTAQRLPDTTENGLTHDETNRYSVHRYSRDAETMAMNLVRIAEVTHRFADDDILLARKALEATT